MASNVSSFDIIRLQLGAIWSSSLPRVERRHLCACAVRASADVATVETHGSSREVFWFESALQVVQDAMQGQHVTIAAAKDILRGAGRSDLASRLAKTSKRQNCSSHPDLQLPGETRAALGNLGRKEASSEAAEAGEMFVQTHEEATESPVASRDEQTLVDTTGTQADVGGYADARIQATVDVVDADVDVNPQAFGLPPTGRTAPAGPGPHPTKVIHGPHQTHRGLF